MAEGIQYTLDTPLRRINSHVIPTFLGNLRAHQGFESEGMYRPVDSTKYRNRVAEYLKGHGIRLLEGQDIELTQPESRDGLELRLGRRQKQDKLDIANRVITLANKVLVTTREKDVNSRDFEGNEHEPQDYLDAILGALDPLTGEDIVDYGSRVSRLMSFDEKRNLVPTVVVDGFRLMSQAYNQEKTQIEGGKGKYTLDELNSRYKQVLDAVLTYSAGIIGQHRKYVLPDEGIRKFGDSIMEKIQEFLRENQIG